MRLRGFYEGFKSLKSQGFPVDAIEPQAAIYLTIKLDIKGKKLPDGSLITDQKQVTQYFLDAAKLAVVPFSAFGAAEQSPWYRLSVGTCTREEIPEVYAALKTALSALK